MKSKGKLGAPHLRENYTDPSQKFHDWVKSLGFERTLLGSILTGLENRFQLRLYGLVFLFSILLAHALNFEIPTPLNYQVGEVARTDLVSPMSFEMVDDVSTEEKRQRAEEAVPVIMDYDPTAFERLSSRIYKGFRLMRDELKKINWPQKNEKREEIIKEFVSKKGLFETELGVEVPNHLFEWLTENRFSVRLENILVRNLEIWYRGRLSEDLDRQIPRDTKLMTLRTVTQGLRGKEVQISRKGILEINHSDLLSLQDLKGLQPGDAREKSNILDLAHRMLIPNVTVNVQEYASRKQQARDSILPVMISVKKNQNILQEGTPVQPGTMALLKEIEALKSSKRKEVLNITLGALFFFFIFLSLLYFRKMNSATKVHHKDLFVLGCIAIFTILLVKFFWFVTEKAFISKFGDIIPSSVFVYLAPVAAAAMIAGLVITSGEMILLFSIFLTFVMAIMSDMNLTFVFLTFAGGVVGAIGVHNCKKRNDIYLAGFYVGLVNAVIIVLSLAFTRTDHSAFSSELVASVLSGFLGGILSGMFALLLVPLVETIFGYTTDVKLLELSNLNHPLLKNMIVKAPGTYHHSIMVGSMVEAAAESIGANPLLGKVMCYYHDIGKMEHSNYFIENQKPGANPHDHISPYMSKTLLIAHVKDGVELGVEHKLGQPIIDGILQHHGTTLISFFYNKALDTKTDEDSAVQEEEFRYPGPKPQFREAALCMLADSIEAAARSLDEPTPTRLQSIVRTVVQRKFMDGQLDECNISLKELSKVEHAFATILLGIYHQRIDYPRGAEDSKNQSGLR